MLDRTQQQIVFWTAVFLFGVFIGYVGLSISLLVIDQAEIILNPTPEPKSIDLESRGAITKDYLKKLAYRISYENAVDPALVFAVIKTESNWNYKAVGASGELGLMQIHPKWHYKATIDPEQNIRIGVTYLKEAINKCGQGIVFNGLRCYNGGINKKSLTSKRTLIYAKKVEKKLKEKREEIKDLFAWDTRSAANHSR